MGNWFNSEIYGAPSNGLFQTVFVEDARGSLLRGYAGSLSSVEFETTERELTTDSLVYPILTASLRFRNLNEDQIAKYTDIYLSKILDSQRKDRKNLLAIDGNTSDIFSDDEGLYSEIDVLGIPRHPTQLFEAFGYWIIFITLALLYLKTSVGERRGFLLGMFLLLLFGFRFFIEYLKEIQVSFEQTMSLNMGQWLSIPLVSIGVLLVVISKKEKL